jgi:hypothetical protein
VTRGLGGLADSLQVVGTQSQHGPIASLDCVCGSGEMTL